MTVADTFAKYLADKRQRGLVDDTTSKLENIFENIREAIPRLVYVGRRRIPPLPGSGTPA
jgi:hypothetical protein